MTTKKHLVLDHDVHLRLQRRKRELGISIKGIGNSILRTCLDRTAPLLDLVRDELIEMHKITAADYRGAVERVMARVAQQSAIDDAFPLPAEGETVVSGSWEIECIHHPSSGGVCIYNCTAHNLRKLMTPSHYHKQDMHVLVLSGVVAFYIGTDQRHLSANSGLYIPAGQVHAKVPLTQDTRCVG